MFGNQFIAIDMGAYSTKVILAKEKGKRLVVLKSFAYKTPPKAISDGSIVDIDKVQAELGFQLKEQQIKCSNVLFSVGTSTTIIRNIVLPATALKDIKSVIRFELEKHVPIRLDEYLIEHEVISRFKEEDIEKLQVVAILMPKIIVDAYWQLANNMRLKPVGLTTHYNSIKSMFLTKSLFIDSELEDKTIALVDLGHEHIICHIIIKGEFKSYRMISAGGRDITLSMANALNISAEELEKRKVYFRQTKSEKEVAATTALAEKEVPQEALVSSIDNLITQVQRFFTFQERSSAVEKIDGIYIYGGCLQFDDLCQHFVRVTGIPTEILRTNRQVSFAATGSDDITSLLYNALGVIKNASRRST